MAFAAVMAGGAAAQDQPGWCKSKWGPDDEKGAANMVTPETVLAAAKLVKAGKTYPLGVETNAKTPAFAPRTWSTVVLQPGQVGGVTIGGTKTTYNDDIHMGWVGTGSQIDGLGHLGIDNVYYNCVKSGEFVAANGLKKLGIEKIPPLVARGIVLDMTAVTGENPVKEGTPFNKKEIDAALQRQNIELRKGDVVLFHTGWLSLVGKDDERYNKAEPGLGKEGAEYLAGKEVLAVGADSWGLEVLPFEPGVGVFEVHQILLAKNGIYILENMNTAGLVADQAWEFMFVESHGRITGGVQAIINPVAIR
jgi:kynurenine formamidase